MKFSFMTFSCPALTLDEALALARQYGYDGIEPRVDAKHAHGVEPGATPEQRRAIRQKALDAGVALACIATSCRFADPGDAAAQADHARQCLDLAADVGAPCVRVFGGKLGEGMSRADAVRHVADVLRPLAAHARERQVVLCMETHDSWCDPADVAAVMRAVDHPGLAVNWDIMHPVRMHLATIDQSFEQLRPWIRHVHVHDGANRDGKLTLTPIGTGDIDHARAVQLLRGAGYTGFLSGEWIGWSDPYAVHLPREIATLRQYLAD